MIVKNEKEVLKRCLDSVKPLIGYWVIVDTGSIDGTQEFIQEHMKDIPGELHERPWKNFGFNRSEAIRLAKNKGDYLLFIDADDWLEIDAGFQSRFLDKDVYNMCRGTNTFSYDHPQLAKGSLPWKYVGVAHEYLTCDVPHTSELLREVRYMSGHGGARSKVPGEKFFQYIKLLEKGLKGEPHNARYAFYLAESYRDAKLSQEALKAYQKRIAMGGWDQEVFWSLLQVAHLQWTLSFPMDTVISSYYHAHYFRPHRPEPLYYLADIFNQQQNFAMAYATVRSRDVISQPSQKDILFRMDWIENYGLLFQRSICSYHLGHYQESLDACDALLQMDDLPENLKTQTLANRAFSLEKV